MNGAGFGGLLLPIPVRVGTRTGMAESSTTTAWLCSGYVFSSLFSLANKRKCPFYAATQEDEAIELGA